MFLRPLAGLVAAACVSLPAAAQTAWPSKPIRIIEPAVAGSAVDVYLRRVTPKLSEALGQPIVVENKPGANGAIGAREAARAPADGYTIFHGNINNSINDALVNDACCRLTQEFAPVTRLTSTALMMVVHPSVPARTLKEYVDYAKANPGQLTYASGGTGAITQLIGEKLKIAAGISLREVPYKSIGAELPDLTAGHVQTAFLAPIVISQHVKAGRLRALAVPEARRAPSMADVPTMAEGGVSGVDATGWNGIFVPAGTPEPVIRRLQQEFSRVLNLKEVRDEAASLATEVGGESVEEFSAFVKNEIAKWGRLIKEAGIKAE
jgi:tripartite-type tricarboxylate transporter receptor subunit TctC